MTSFLIIDDYNAMFRRLAKRDNPQFDNFMTKMAELLCDTLGATNYGVNWPQRFVFATHLLRCLFQRWCYVTPSESYYFVSHQPSKVIRSLEACRERYGEALRAHQGKLDQLLEGINGESLVLLLEQLEGLVAKDEARTLQFAGLLEMAAILANCLGKALPANQRQQPRFNLEELLAVCAAQAGDHETFGREVAPFLALAACSGVGTPENVQRLARCIQDVSGLLKGNRPGRHMRLAVAACSRGGLSFAPRI